MCLSFSAVPASMSPYFPVSVCVLVYVTPPLFPSVQPLCFSVILFLSPSLSFSLTLSLAHFSPCTEVHPLGSGPHLDAWPSSLCLASEADLNILSGIQSGPLVGVLIGQAASAPPCSVRAGAEGWP